MSDKIPTYTTQEESEAISPGIASDVALPTKDVVNDSAWEMSDKAEPWTQKY